MATILLGVSGSIAAYKAADVASKLQQRGHAVTAIMTRSATELVSPNTFLNLTGNRVYVDMFDPSQVGQTEHIKLTDRADLFLIAPATANVLAKMALGLADDMLTTTLLAVRCPVVVCPAMNTRMWEHPVVQRNLAAVRHLGVHVVEPDSGSLACGHVGPGRLAEPDRIVQAVDKVLAAGARPLGARLFLERQTFERDPDAGLLARERIYREALELEGVLVGSGLLGDGARDALHVIRARDMEEARDRAQASPLVETGLAQVEVTEWRLERGEIVPGTILPNVASPDEPTVHIRKGITIAPDGGGRGA